MVFSVFYRSVCHIRMTSSCASPICISPSPAGTISGIQGLAQREGEGWRVPPLPLEGFGVTDPDDLSWAAARIGMQPLATFEQEVPLESPFAAALSRTFILCSAGNGFTTYAERARTEPGWTVHELMTLHDAMLTVPHDLAQMLLTIAQ